MKKLFLLSFLLLLSNFGQGQTTGAGFIIYVSSAPSGTCSAGAYQENVIGLGTVYSCQSGTWAQIGGVSGVAWGAITGTLSNQTDLQSALNLKAPLESPTFTGVPAVPTAAPGTSTTQAASTAFVLANALGVSLTGPPTTPTLATVGSAGSTSDTYKIVGCQNTTCTLHSAASSATTIATANATLSASNYNVISAYQIYGANCYNIYRTAATGTPSTTGKIASCVGLQYADKGAAGDSTTAPSADTTALVSNPWPVPGCAIAVGGLIGPDAPPCTPNAKDDEMFETASFPDARWTVGGSGLGTGTFTAANSTWVYGFQPGNGADLWAPVLQATPANPWTFTQKSVFTRTIGVTNNQIVGMCVTDGTASSSKIIDFDVKADSTINVNQWTNSTSFGSTPFSQGVSWLNTLAPIYLRIQDDGTNLKFSLSQDGKTFQQVSSQARLSFLASVADIGFCGESTSTSATPSIAMYWFRRTQ